MDSRLNKWSGVIIGGILALGAPLGWLFFSIITEKNTIVEEISHNKYLYIYMLLSTEIVFTTFGYVVGSLVKDLKNQAITDPLTQIPNKRLFEPALREIVSKGPTIMLMIDLDNFKLVNDQLGHLVGDAALIKVGNIIKRSIRQVDICARLGGDEFAIVLPGATLEQAYIVAERLIKELNVVVTNIHPKCGASVGIGGIEKGGNPTTLIELADSALYRAKKAGGKTVKHLLSDRFLLKN